MKLLVEGWTEDGLVNGLTGVDTNSDLSGSFSEDFILTPWSRFHNLSYDASFLVFV